MSELYIKYFIIKPQRQWESYEDCLQYHIDALTNYYKHWGKDGFLSERIFKKDILNLAEIKANNVWEKMASITGELQMIKLKQDTEKEMISMIENRKDFIKWVGNKVDENKN